MRIVSNIGGLERVAPSGVDVQTLTPTRVPSTWPRNLRLLWMALSADHLILHFALREVAFFASALFLLAPFHRCRLTTLDFFVVSPSPSTMPLIRWWLGRVHCFLIYFRDTADFTRRFGIPPSRFRFIPFKVNSWELVQAATPTDKGYLCVAGRSRRDFATLFAAVRDLPYPVRVLTAHEPDLTPHGSSLAGLKPPPNVEIDYNDSNRQLFVDLLAGARLVVMPVHKDCGVQAGIGVTILAMALAKCVISSTALGVSDVFSPEEVVIVPAGDPAALRSAIVHFWEDTPARTRIAESAHRTAQALGGEDQLRRSILEAVLHPAV